MVDYLIGHRITNTAQKHFFLLILNHYAVIVRCASDFQYFLGELFFFLFFFLSLLTLNVFSLTLVS